MCKNDQNRSNTEDDDDDEDDVERRRREDESFLHLIVATEEKRPISRCCQCHREKERVREKAKFLTSHFQKLDSKVPIPRPQTRPPCGLYELKKYHNSKLLRCRISVKTSVIESMLR